MISCKIQEPTQEPTPILPTFIGALVLAGLTAIGVLRNLSQDLISRIALQILPMFVIIVAQLAYVFISVREKRRGALEV